MRLQRRSGAAAFAMVQALVATGIIIIGGLASVQALVLTNRKASTMRTVNNARAVVQRNIDTALGVPFSATLQPAILAVTSNSGSPYDETGGTNPTVNVVVTRNGASAVVQGTLTRIVTQEANADGADIRRITFRLNYAYRARNATEQNYAVEMTTLRATD